MISKLWQRIFKRRQSYRRLSMDADGRAHPAAEVVLADLKRFCRADTSTMGVSPVSRAIDPMAVAMAEGRREVWNRIQSYLHMADREITQLTEENEEARQANC
jgi:hypothetical protein